MATYSFKSFKELKDAFDLPQSIDWGKIESFIGRVQATELKELPDGRVIFGVLLFAADANRIKKTYAKVFLSAGLSSPTTESAKTGRWYWAIVPGIGVAAPEEESASGNLETEIIEENTMSQAQQPVDMAALLAELAQVKQAAAAAVAASTDATRVATEAVVKANAASTQAAAVAADASAAKTAANNATIEATAAKAAAAGAAASVAGCATKAELEAMRAQLMAAQHTTTAGSGSTTSTDATAEWTWTGLLTKGAIALGGGYLLYRGVKYFFGSSEEASA